MTEAQRPKPPPPKTEKPKATLVDIPGVFTVSIERVETVSLPRPKPAPGHYAPGALALVALISAILLLGLFLGLGRRKRRKP
ncbi:hypothetical protein [Caulobacter sp. RL271]|jgi:hypothetical protein|uniref:Gram-positive cocci surface proteins LPxTG domain-containing protein n=1 Tax=Caulobacter segnis TaxID=88688 RepID=A0ABY4ZTQ8_9CAUL|nr:hypothetical protein [Caulobacter segnis]USQ95966.1 hypothetical protein MZV50_26090 [Caulobacter segnis]